MNTINLITFLAFMAEFVPILGITLTLLIERAKHLAEHHQSINDVNIIIDQLKAELEKDLKNTKIDKKTKDQSRSKIIGMIRAYSRFLISSNPQFSDAMLGGNTSSAATSQGGKEFRFQNTKGLFTYICKDFHLTKEQVMEWFTKHERIGHHIEKAIACDEIAPETGEKHVHIWIQMDERFDNKNARKFFTIDSVTPNIKPGGNPAKCISYCVKGKNYITHNMDPNYEMNTRKMHQQLLGYQLINKQLNMRKATEIYPELLWKYDTVKSNLNSYFHDAEMENNPGNKLDIWSMFGIETMFGGKNKIPQYWIVGPSNVGKTYNIDLIEQGGHRAYLMNKENDWSDYKDDDYDFMYNEETGSDFKLTFLNQMLEGTRLKLNGKFTKSITKKKNMPIILNSNYMPHMLYKNKSIYELEPTLNRLYIIYVDKNRKGHIIWNPYTMNVKDYEEKFIYYENMDMYEDLFKDEYENEYQDQHTFIRYAKNSGQDGVKKYTLMNKSAEELQELADAEEYINKQEEKYNNHKIQDSKQYDPPKQTNRGWSTVKSPAPADCRNWEDVLNDIKCEELITEDMDWDNPPEDTEKHKYIDVSTSESEQSSDYSIQSNTPKHKKKRRRNKNKRKNKQIIEETEPKDYFKKHKIINQVVADDIDVVKEPEIKKEIVNTKPSTSITNEYVKCEYNWGNKQKVNTVKFNMRFFNKQYK